jgi:hypothetical protein
MNDTTSALAAGLTGPATPLPPALAEQDLVAIGVDFVEIEAKLGRVTDEHERRVSDPSLDELKDHVRRERIAGIRAETRVKAEPTADELAELHRRLEAQRDHFTREGIAARAVLSAVTKAPHEYLAFADVVAKASPGELHSLARLISSPGVARLDLALAIERAATALPPEASEARSGIIRAARACPLPKADEAAANRLSDLLARSGALRIQLDEITSGQSQPERRLALGLFSTTSRSAA